MAKTIILTGTAIVNFKRVMHDVPDDEVQELLENNDLRESQIDDDDLRDIECIHDDVAIEVQP
ncbi:hypothetical protein AS889_00625 [Pseudomonas putida]|uniref:hypothetical protein n=1 Tax=Pseudomonas putida TaxID=303 RepID=UPI0007716C14|nr:hypothetical protein [Pseudomonas putida]KWW20261.1 hypothetical protein AS889_00625 [Pseudomonas putida]